MCTGSILKTEYGHGSNVLSVVNSVMKCIPCFNLLASRNEGTA